jgi:hypothetical protein
LAAFRKSTARFPRRWCQPATRQGLTAAIAKAIDDPKTMNQMNQMTQMLRTQVAASFSADAMVDGVLAGYEQAIGRVPALSRGLLAHA